MLLTFCQNPLFDPVGRFGGLCYTPPSEGPARQKDRSKKLEAAQKIPPAAQDFPGGGRGPVRKRLGRIFGRPQTKTAPIWQPGGAMAPERSQTKLCVILWRPPANHLSAALNANGLFQAIYLITNSCNRTPPHLQNDRMTLG